MKTPVLDGNFLDTVLGSGSGSAADRICNETPMTIMRLAMKDTMASDYYHSLERWKRRGLAVKDLRILFKNERTDKFLSSTDCLKLINEYIVPLWNYVYKENKHVKRKNQIETVEDILIKRKGELMYLIWLVYSCTKIPDLEIAIIISPSKS